MGNVSRLFFTEQAKISQLNYGDLAAILADGETTIYIDMDGVLKIATKNGPSITENNAAGDIIQSLFVPERPTTFPSPSTGYALLAVRKNDGFKLVWGGVDTLGNYNVISGATTYTVYVTRPTFQIYDVATPGNYDFNGMIAIVTSGDGAFVAKKYSIDNGVTYGDFDFDNYHEISNIGDVSTTNYDLKIADNYSVLYSEALTMLGADYDIEIVTGGLFEPTYLTHITFKENDPSTSNPDYDVTVVVDDEDTFLPGLYRYIIYVNGVLMYDMETTDKTISVPIVGGLVGDCTTIVERKHGGYLKIGNITNYLGSFVPGNNFTWSADNGNNFVIPSTAYSGTEIFVKDNTTSPQELFVYYSANDIGTPSTLFAKRGSTDEIYQTTQTISQNTMTSTPTNSLIVSGTTGMTNDVLFDTPFTPGFSYFAPRIITNVNPIWVNSSTPPYLPVDLAFQGALLTNAYAGSLLNSKLTMSVYDISGNLIWEEDGVYAGYSVLKGEMYDFLLEDFKLTILPYYNQVVRIRFKWVDDTTSPVDIFLSELKYVKFI